MIRPLCQCMWWAWFNRTTWFNCTELRFFYFYTYNQPSKPHVLPQSDTIVRPSNLAHHKLLIPIHADYPSPLGNIEWVRTTHGWSCRHQVLERHARQSRQMSKVEPPTGSQPVEISAQIVSPFLTMLVYLKTFNKSNPVILLDFRWGEGAGSGLVSVGHLG